MAQYRTIIDGEKFTQQLRTLGDIRRLDEILSGVRVALAQRPEEAGLPTRYPNIWYIATVPWNTEAFVIFYSFDSERVCLEAIFPADQPAD